MLSDAARRDPAMTGQYDYERVEADFYPTPPEYVDCLAHHLPLSGTKWWEPAAGRGDIAHRVESITGELVTMTDILHHRLPNGEFNDRVHIADFLAQKVAPAGIDGIITNPPYLTIADLDCDEWRHLLPLATAYGLGTKKVSLAELFLRHAITLMEPVRGKVAMFLRNEFDCGSKRMNLFRDVTFQMKVVTTARPRWIEGSTGSPRHNYSWFVFDWTNLDDSVVRYAHPKTSKPILPIKD